MIPSSLRVKLHRLRGVSIGRNVAMGVDVHIDDFSPGIVIIEDNARVSAGCMFLTHQRDLSVYQKECINGMIIGDCPYVKKPILVKSGAQIGIRSIIMPGVTIGKGSIIGAGSLVTKDIPDYCIAVGTPAKVVRELNITSAIKGISKREQQDDT